MTKYFQLRFLAVLVSVVVVFSCDDSSSDLYKEKEMRLLRQYLESKNITVEPESNGLYFISHHQGNGIKPEMDHWVIIRYTTKLINDRVIDTTDEIIAISNNIYSTERMYGNQRLSMSSLGVMGVIEGLLMMNEGSAATLIIPSHLAYGNAGTGTVPPYSTIIYDIELVKVIKDPVAYEQELIGNYISTYADSTHLIMLQRESGLYFIRISDGTGDSYPEDSDQVSVYYTGRLTDGRVFDTNAGGSSFDFYIGKDQTIPGFEEGVKLMKLNGRSRILVPSSIGYGEIGSGNKIPGHTPLVFDLELVYLQELKE